MCDKHNFDDDCEEMTEEEIAYYLEQLEKDKELALRR